MSGPGLTEQFIGVGDENMKSDPGSAKEAAEKVLSLTLSVR